MTTATRRSASTERRRRLSDALLAGALLALVELAVLPKQAAWSGLMWLAVTAGAVAVIPLAWRRQAPLIVLVVSGAATLAVTIGHGSPGLMALAPLAALYTVATVSPRRISSGAAAISLAGATVGVIAGHHPSLTWEDFLLPWALIAAAWLIGDNLRVRRAYVAELEAKAARADADRAAEAERAAARERARIARELHDVVVHHVSVIAVQAAGAGRMARRAGVAADTQRALADVEATARQALTELRQLLGVLRHNGDPPALSPAPGLDQLDQLVCDVRRAGLPVLTKTEGDPSALPAAVDLSAYRIIQEALTNIIKHAGSAPTTLTVTYSAADLRIEVSNDAPPGDVTGPAPGAGHGLAGMRERVAMFGGELDAGPAPRGGFAVRARIPIEGAAR